MKKLVNFLRVLGFAVGVHTHQLVLTLIDLKAAIGGERRIQESKAVREAHLFDELDLVAVAYAESSRAPLARAVNGQDRRLLIGRREEARSSVRHVVVAKQDLRTGNTKLARHHRLDPKFIGNPALHGLSKDRRRARKSGHRCDQHALELNEWLLVKHDVVDVVDCKPSLLQDEFYGECWKTRVVLFAAEALLC